MSAIYNPNIQFVIKVIFKGIILLLILNFLFIGINQLPYGKITLYNILFPGRERLPFGENPTESFNLTINNIDAMFSSMKIDRQNKKNDEFRVFFVGDSSVWGSLLNNSDSLVGQINQQNFKTCNGLTFHAYNLGYPTLSVLKDLLIIDKALPYRPDLIIWLVTLESFPTKNQLTTPLLVNNPLEVQKLVNKYSLIGKDKNDMVEINFWDQTLIGQRRNIADLFRLQIFGILWTATGIDQNLNVPFNPAKRDFDQDDTFHGLSEHVFSESELSFEIVEKAVQNIEVPIIMINEPILISTGKNSDIRYNFYYPRWAYDQYRLLIEKAMIKSKIPYYDFYNLVAENLFTNSAIHLNSTGEAILVQKINKILADRSCQNRNSQIYLIYKIVR